MTATHDARHCETKHNMPGKKRFTKDADQSSGIGADTRNATQTFLTSPRAREDLRKISGKGSMMDDSAPMHGELDGGDKRSDRNISKDQSG
ncbi:hypothetical protein Aduo_008276 [Ancylostoma duodenale]